MKVKQETLPLSWTRSVLYFAPLELLVFCTHISHSNSTFLLFFSTLKLARVRMGARLPDGVQVVDGLVDGKQVLRSSLSGSFGWDPPAFRRRIRVLCRWSLGVAWTYPGIV